MPFGREDRLLLALLWEEPSESVAPQCSGYHMGLSTVRVAGHVARLTKIVVKTSELSLAKMAPAHML